MPDAVTRAQRLQQAIGDLLVQSPEVQAAAVVSFDGLAMASALPTGMDEDRVAAMSAALLSLGERAAEGLGRGELSQVYIEGENGNVYLVSAGDEAVLVVVAAAGAKVGMVLYEVRLAADVVADILRRQWPAQEEAGTVVEPLAEEPAAEPLAELPFDGEPAPAYSEPVAPFPRPPLAGDVDPLGLGGYQPLTAPEVAEPTSWSGYLPTGGSGETTDWN
jgi:predicted regulator of Ras-like GTPase activity (Roadblock/LC7/MglB family)